jgi:glucose-1-phosphate thymidylyltransferase
MSLKKGIILAGGTGSRLFPITKSVNKHLLPIYDKPMIFYSLSTLLLLGIKDILIITSPDYLNLYKDIFNDGSFLGININYAIQEEANGIPEAFLIGESFIDKNRFSLILGDNMFFGSNLKKLLNESVNNNKKSTIFSYKVNNPEKYGVIDYNKNNKAKLIIEKPNKFISNDVVTGLYIYSHDVINIAKKLKPSNRGELEITDINNYYIKNNSIDIVELGRGTTWIDAGSFNSLNDASNIVKSMQERQGLKISCPEEISWRNGNISNNDLLRYSKKLNNSYGRYLISLLK